MYRQKPASLQSSLNYHGDGKPQYLQNHHCRQTINYTHPCAESFITLWWSLRGALPITISKAVYDNCYIADHQQKIDISVWRCFTLPGWLTSPHLRLRYRHTAFTESLSSLNCCNMQHYACLQTSHSHSTAHKTQYRSSFLTLTWNNREPLKNQCACKLFSQASPQRCANHLAGHPLSCSTASLGIMSSWKSIKHKPKGITSPKNSMEKMSHHWTLITGLNITQTEVVPALGSKGNTHCWGKKGEENHCFPPWSSYSSNSQHSSRVPTKWNWLPQAMLQQNCFTTGEESSTLNSAENIREWGTEGTITSHTIHYASVLFISFLTSASKQREFALRLSQ